MEYNEFLAFAGITELLWWTSAKGHDYAPTTKGTVFETKGYNPKGKIKYLIPGTDDNTGRPIWRLTNQKPKRK